VTVFPVPVNHKQPDCSVFIFDAGAHRVRNCRLVYGELAESWLAGENQRGASSSFFFQF
jgi:hypothetical protein